MERSLGGQNLTVRSVQGLTFGALARRAKLDAAFGARFNA